MNYKMYKPLAILAAVLMLLSVACSFGNTPKVTDTPQPTATEVQKSNPTKEPVQADATNTPAPKADVTKAPTAAKGAVTTLDDVRNATIQIEAEGTYIDPQVGVVINGAGRGSGFIIDSTGLAITNNHVVTGAALLKVWIGGDKNKVYNAKVIAVSECSDLAVIKIDGSDFSFLQWHDAAPKVGLEVYLAGFPLGDPEYSLTKGIISKTNGPNRLSWASVGSTLVHSATSNPGNSGGPLVDLTGKVVGINTRGGGQNLNFAIPIDTAKEVVARILASATPTRKGRVERSDLGIDLKPLQDLEAFYNIDINKGVLVNSVDRNSAAAKAGVKTQDILLALNDQPINVRFPESLAPARKLIASLPVGSEVKLDLRRGKEVVSVTAKTVKLESEVGEERELKEWGLSVRDVTRALAADRQLDDDTGVIVTTLSPGYPAAKALLVPGDVIYTINGQAVTDLDRFSEIYDKLIADKATQVLIEIQRGRGRQSAVLRMK